MDLIRMFARLLTFVKNVWRRHGWHIFGYLLWKNVAFFLSRCLPSASSVQTSSVDRLRGVETQRPVYLSSLGVLDNLSNPYEPISEDEFCLIVESLGIDYPSYDFVDLGSGKGRALMLASKFGFHRVTGVEFSPVLHQRAVKNLDAAKGVWPNVDSIKLICGDAGDFVPPLRPLVLFMFNPFGAFVMARVLEQWRKLEQAGHDFWILYKNPEHIQLLKQCEYLEYLSSSHGYAIFRRKAFNCDVVGAV